MPSTNSILQVDLREALNHLIAVQTEVSDRLREQVRFPLSLQNAEAGKEPRQTIADFISLVVYANDEMEAGDTINCIGLCGTDHETLLGLERITLARKAVQKVLMEMDKYRMTEDKEVITLSKKALAQLGYARFNRRQAKRAFFYFDHSLDSVSFTWARSRQAVALSVAHAKTILTKRFQGADELIEQESWHAQRLLLDSLPADEPLVQVAPPAIHPRANITWHDEKGDFKRQVKVAVSPIFYLASEHGALPRIRPLVGDKDEPAVRLRRNDVQIEDDPYIPSIRVHRYQEKFRLEKKRARQKTAQGTGI
jgi:hypothetical protein